MEPRSTPNPRRKSDAFRVGRVRAYRRGQVWYLCYHENGRRRQPRVGPDKAEARRLAAEINAQIESGGPTTLGFESIGLSELRKQWLDHHENVRRSSLHTIRRYRSASEHLLNFVRDVRPLKKASDLRPIHAEEFVRHLRRIRVAPNGHPKAKKRPLRDAGIKFILETCSGLFHYAAKRRHLPPYAENPFKVIESHRVPTEDGRRTLALDDDQQVALLRACDDWQFPLMLTLLFTGLRPGEATHLLLPNDLDLESGWLKVRNKPGLGWMVKTRNERDVPLNPILVEVLKSHLRGRRHGPVFRQRRCSADYTPPLSERLIASLEREVACRAERALDGRSPRVVRQAAARTVWRDLGTLREEWVRLEFMRLTASISLPSVTTPKTLRHTFATMLQDANVDPLVRNELMGHAPASVGGYGVGLGMTGVYTHTRPETKRRQLEGAFRDRPAGELAVHWLKSRIEQGMC